MSRNSDAPCGASRAEPSAPPLHMMQGSTTNQQVIAGTDPNSIWGPPPRYDEAIAGSQDTCESNTRLPAQQLPIQTSHIQNDSQSLNNQQSRSSSSTESNQQAAHHPPNQQNYSRQSGSLSIAASRTPETRSTSRVRARYRSASPTNTFDENNASGGSGRERGSSVGASDDESSERRKKSSGSKIKKGLENIAFFIIQILD